MTDRQEKLQNWVQIQLQAQGIFTKNTGYSDSVQPVDLSPLQGDASFRRYFRLKNVSPPLIAVDSPNETEDNPAFVAVTQCWASKGIPVPELIAHDLANGFLLLSDLGDQSLFSLLNDETSDQLYRQAIDCLVDIQRSPRSHQGFTLPNFSHDLYLEELGLFKNWFIDQLLGRSVDELGEGAYDKYCTQLIASADQQSQVCVHRDYHSRNFMVLPDSHIAVIDYQDAVWGPVSYDLVSLLRDSYVELSVEDIGRWQRYYFESAQLAGVDVGSDMGQFERWFDWTGIQRQLKVMGIFARLWLRDGKTRYLQDIPRTLNYCIQASSKYSELQELASWLESEVKPACQQRLSKLE